MDLVGRDAEARRLAELIAGENRLVSVSGRSGVGKSALVSLVPALVSPSRDVWAVDLAAAPDGTRMLDEIARMRGLATAVMSAAPDSAGERLVAAIGRSPVVLVADHADSCEVDDQLVRDLLERCPELVVVVVAAAPMGERAAGMSLAPLRAPPPDARPEELMASPSVRLFAARADRVSPGFRLDATTAASVAEICRLVGGLPLAIELAAARTGMLSLDRLARELRTDGSASAALDILTPRPGHAKVGIRDALASTQRLLGARERLLLTRLAVFRGPFTFDAALGVADAAPAEVLDDLGALVDLRLVEPVIDDRREPSFLILPLVRSFVREGALATDADLARRSAVLGALAREAAVATARAARSDAVHDMRVMRHDIAHEIRRLADTDLDAAAAMAVDAATVLGGYPDAASIDDVLETLVSSGAVERLAQAQAGRVWLWASSALAHSPDGSAQRDRVNERWLRGIGLIDPVAEPHLALQARLIAVMNGSLTGDPALSARAASEGRVLAEEFAHPAWLARFEVFSASTAHASGDIPGATALVTRGLERGLRVGDTKAIVDATVILHALPPGSIGDAAAFPDLEDALQLALEQHDPIAASLVLAALTERDLTRGDPASAARWCLRRLTTGRRNGWSHLAAVSLVHAALIAVAFGDVAFAARMAGAVRADQERTFRSLGPAALAGFERAKVGIRGRLGAAHTARVIAGGGLLSTPDATAAAVLWLEDRSAVEPPVIPAPPGPLTAREQDVLELLASGMTNRQIAEQLGLSVKTVMHHSVSIYRKLGVRGRAEATATAYRYRLLRAASEHADS